MGVEVLKPEYDTSSAPLIRRVESDVGDETVRQRSFRHVKEGRAGQRAGVDRDLHLAVARPGPDDLARGIATVEGRVRRDRRKPPAPLSHIQAEIVRARAETGPAHALISGAVKAVRPELDDVACRGRGEAGV